MLRRINESLPVLVIGIVAYGVLLQFTGMWFVADKLHYSIGLWYGIAIAIGTAINMAIVIYDSIYMEIEEGKSNRLVVAKSVARYIVVAALMFILGYFNLGNVISAFLGLMGLKVSAYLYPVINRVVNKVLGRDDAAPNEEEKINKEVTL